MKLSRNAFSGLIFPVLLILIWAVVCRLGFIKSALLPSPQKVFLTLALLLKDGNIFTDIALTIVRVAKGFIIGAVAGFMVGVLMGMSKTVEKVVGPSLHMFRQVPLVGWIPLIILWCGSGEPAKTVFIALGAFSPMAINTFAGIRSVPERFVEVGRVFEFSRPKLLKRIIIPSALPSLLAGLKLSLNLAWMFVIAAEIMTYSAGGLGALIDGARARLRMDILIAGIVVIGIVGFAMNLILEKLQSSLLRWKGTA